MAARRRVLIIDDNEVVADVLREFLSFAYDVATVTAASKALASVRAAMPDLILLDIRMPFTDGFTLLESLRRVGVTVPIFMITGYDSAQAAERAKRSGATGYLVKPVNLRDLDALIATALKVRPFLTP